MFFFFTLQSGTERSRSRLGSTNDLPLRGENGEIDYKKLYEQTLAENDRLKDKLRKTEEDLRDTKQTLEKINVVVSFSVLKKISCLLMDFCYFRQVRILYRN